MVELVIDFDTALDVMEVIVVQTFSEATEYGVTDTVVSDLVGSKVILESSVKNGYSVVVPNVVIFVSTLSTVCNVVRVVFVNSADVDATVSAVVSLVDAEVVVLVVSTPT